MKQTIFSLIASLALGLFWAAFAAALGAGWGMIIPIGLIAALCSAMLLLFLQSAHRDEE